MQSQTLWSRKRHCSFMAAPQEPTSLELVPQAAARDAEQVWKMKSVDRGKGAKHF